MKLPEWVQREETYNPAVTGIISISRSLLRLVSVLKALRQQHGPSRWNVGAGPALITTLVMILLIVLCRTTASSRAVLAGELVLLPSIPAVSCGRPWRQPWPHRPSVPSSSPRPYFSATDATSFSCPVKPVSPYSV